MKRLWVYLLAMYFWNQGGAAKRRYVPVVERFEGRELLSIAVGPGSLPVADFNAIVASVGSGSVTLQDLGGSPRPSYAAPTGGAVVGTGFVLPGGAAFLGSDFSPSSASFSGEFATPGFSSNFLSLVLAGGGQIDGKPAASQVPLQGNGDRVVGGQITVVSPVEIQVTETFQGTLHCGCYSDANTASVNFVVSPQPLVPPSVPPVIPASQPIAPMMGWTIDEMTPKEGRLEKKKKPAHGRERIAIDLKIKGLIAMTALPPYSGPKVSFAAVEPLLVKLWNAWDRTRGASRIELDQELGRIEATVQL